MIRGFMYINLQRSGYSKSAEGHMTQLRDLAVSARPRVSVNMQFLQPFISPPTTCATGTRCSIALLTLPR